MEKFAFSESIFASRFELIDNMAITKFIEFNTKNGFSSNFWK